MVLRWVLGLGFCIAGSAGWAMGGQNGVMGRMVPARADAPSVAAASSARSQYMLSCAGCHGFDGAGSKRSAVPDMRRLGLFLRVPGGREFIVKVPGVMGSGLSDEQVAEVTNWVLSGMARASVPAATPPYTAEEIRRARAGTPVDVMKARSELVAAARAIGLDL
jgi:mono/diheme cytochrome c family protein